MFTNNFSKETWQQKYKAPSDETVEDTFRRVAHDLALAEEPEKREEYENAFYELMLDFKFVPGGRILSNAGAGFKGTTMLNCYTHGAIPPDADSLKGIYKALAAQAEILKSEGGYGFCCSFMRPRGAHIKGIAGQSPGAIQFLDLWDISSATVTAGSGKKARHGEKQVIRKGAQMVTIHCCHPDVEEFIEAKRTPGRLTKFNMSVLCTDDFMRAVDQDKDWNLIFPNYEAYPKLYRAYWDGNFKQWEKLAQESDESDAEPFVVYKTMKARELWDKIMRSTYDYNDPGVIFIDNVNNKNTLWYCEDIMSTNPCGEIPLPIGGVCLLGSFNLTQYILPNKKDWDYKKLERDIPIAVRMLDNVNDRTYVPLAIQKDNLQQKRRIGIGIFGYGSALLMMKVRYGSEEALKLTENLMKFIVRHTHLASIDLAKEKGPFPLFDCEKYLQSGYAAVLPKDIVDGIKKYGIRNAHLTSIQPTGNTSCFANTASSGLEPVFMFEYIRTAIYPVDDNTPPIPKGVDWLHRKPVPNWEWIQEGRDYLLQTHYNGSTWKYDKQRGLLKEEHIEDYGVRYLKEHNEWDENADWAVTALSLSVDDHVKTMGVFARYVSQGISKTISVPNEIPYETFKDIYLKAWENGIKGFTTYRLGTMSTVLAPKKDNVVKVPKTVAPERPRELPCEVHHISVKGQKYFVLVGMFNGDPYEIFAGQNGFIDNSVQSGIIVKLGRPKGVYKAVLDNGLELSPINATCSPEEDALTRMCSTALRHGADIHMIVKQLERVKGDMTSFAKSMARTLKKYIPDGTEAGECPECGGRMVREEGCKKCMDCSFSACS